MYLKNNSSDENGRFDRVGAAMIFVMNCVVARLKFLRREASTEILQNFLLNFTRLRYGNKKIDKTMTSDFCFNYSHKVRRESSFSFYDPERWKNDKGKTNSGRAVVRIPKRISLSTPRKHISQYTSQ